MSATPPTTGSVPPVVSPPTPNAVPPVAVNPPVVTPVVPPSVATPPTIPPASPVVNPPTATVPPTATPPVPVAVPPAATPPVPVAVPPAATPPVPVAVPPTASPPVPVAVPPAVSPPPPVAVPPALSPPAPVAVPPALSPPPPDAVTPSKSPPPPDAVPPSKSPPPPAIVPPALSPPSPTSTSPPQPTPVPPSDPGGTPPSPVLLSPPPAVNRTSPAALTPPASTSSNSSSTAIIAGVVGGGALLALVALVLLFVCCRKKRSRKDTLPYITPHGGGNRGAGKIASAYNVTGTSDLEGCAVDGNPKVYPPGSIPLPPEGVASVGNSRVFFTYDELHKATNGFAHGNLLGEGGFGRVYKGELPNGKFVAVKQLTVGGGQGDREFRAEVEIISRVHHRHLVSLVGYCISDKQRLLVYDFVPNGTLDVNLYGRGKPVMTWDLRVRVALGAARGLAYLHEDCHPRIIHRDIKSSNILLDDKYEAQVADFGLARPASDTNTHVSTRVMGTFGYLAPEYARSGKLTEKSDVYSFGVMLLELITGRKPVDTRDPNGAVSLVELARPLMTKAMEDGDLDELVDPRLGDNYDPKEMFRMIEVAASCVRQTANKRPKMGQVVRALESEEENAGLYQNLKPGHSSEYESEFDRYESSNYDTQAYLADLKRGKKSNPIDISYESDNTSEYPTESVPSSSGEYESMIRPKTEPMGRANMGKERGSIPTRTDRGFSMPGRASRSENYSVLPSMPPTRPAPPRPDSSSDRSGSLRSDTVFKPPPPPPNYNEDYVSIDFNSIESRKEDRKRFMD